MAVIMTLIEREGRKETGKETGKEGNKERRKDPSIHPFFLPAIQVRRVDEEGRD